ncbi:MAG TPA: response regulator, partial [Longimicrobiales bacterium]
SGGYIWVYSEPGQGTTFEVYLPRVEAVAEEPETPRPHPEPHAAPGGSEVVLLVEDEEAVRALVRKVLQRNGYRVLEAAEWSEALAIFHSYEGPIHLLLTDVVMPELSGRELAERLSQLRPEMKVLFMSGYTDDEIFRHGVLNAGAAFIGKPFSPQELAQKVREVLDAPPVYR